MGCKLSSPSVLNHFVILWFFIWGNIDLLCLYSDSSLRARCALPLLAHSCSILKILLTALVRAVTTWSTLRQQRSVHTWVCHRVPFLGWSNEILTHSDNVMTAECVIWLILRFQTWFWTLENQGNEGERTVSDTWFIEMIADGWHSLMVFSITVLLLNFLLTSFHIHLKDK